MTENIAENVETNAPELNAVNDDNQQNAPLPLTAEEIQLAAEKVASSATAAYHLNALSSKEIEKINDVIKAVIEKIKDAGDGLTRTAHWSAEEVQKLWDEVARPNTAA